MPPGQPQPGLGGAGGAAQHRDQIGVRRRGTRKGRRGERRNRELPHPRLPTSPPGVEPI